ncbi:MAG: hypothetical protein ACTSPY_02545 [Candidatus Helarchaeota archaeon]
MKKIICRLSSANAYYYDRIKEKWKKVTPFLDELPENTPIRISGKEYNRLEYNYELGYFYGLVIGSKYSIKDEFKVIVEINQLKFIEWFSDRIGITFSAINQERRRKSYRRQFFHYYQKVQVKFHNSFRRYLKAYGLNIEHPKILTEFPDEMKLGIINGLLDSKKAHFVFNNRQHGLHEYLIIRLLDSKILSSSNKRYLTNFLMQIRDILFQLGIKCSVNKKGLTVSGKSNLILLFKHFSITKIKAIALSEILKLRIIEPYYTTIINLYPLSEIDLVILGYLYYEINRITNDYVPYTYLESVLKVGSQIIRSSLYKLDELGFIKYFARGRKEFISKSDKVINKTKKALEQKYNLLKTGDETIIVECAKCYGRIEYFLYLNENMIFCPYCGTLINITNKKSVKGINELRTLTRFLNSILKNHKEFELNKSTIIINK